MFTLKKVEYHAGLSQETHAYGADLYLNGKKVAQVGNAGHGGCDEVHYINAQARKAVEGYIEALNYTFLDDAAMAAEIRRRIRRMIEIGDDAYSKNDWQHSDEKLCAEYSNVLDIQWMQHDLDKICCDLMNDWLGAKELKRLLSKRVLWTKPGEAGIYQTQTARNAANRDRWIDEIAGGTDVDIVLNNEPFEDALKLFKERTR